MKTEGWKYIYTKEEVGQVIKNWLAKNPDADVNDIISYLLSQDNIYVADGNKLSNIKPIWYVYQWDEWLKELLSYADFSVDKNNNIIKWVEDNSLKKDDLTKDEKISLSSSVDKDKYTKIWDDELAWFDETEPLMENAKRIATAYRKLLDEKNKITDDYDSWQWWDKNIYLQRIKDISSALRDAENSPEFKYIVNQIKENWITREDKNFSPIVSTTLTDMARHEWSLFWLKPAKGTGWRLANWINWDLDNSWIVRFLQWVTPQDMNNLENLPDIYSNTNKKINEYLGKKKWNKDKKSEDIKEHWTTKWKYQSNIWDKEVTDNMKFWDDVTSKDYLDRRNNTLVMHLQQNWITDKEAINKYLEQYDSWKNAKKEWKDNTLNNLTSLIDKNNKDKETKKKEQEKNKEEQKKNDNKDKKDDTLYDKNWNAVWSKWTPSNDDSINWVEDEYIYDKNWNKVWSKAKTEKKTDKKKDVDMNKLLPNSAVIKWLLNIKKSK